MTFQLQACHQGSVFCIGRNYGAHAKELGNPIPEQPIVFMKPRSALVYPPFTTVALPWSVGQIDHEVEVVLVIHKEAKNIAPAQAIDVIGGFAVGIDFTARDVQNEAKKKGHPWTLAKGLNGFAPLSSFYPAQPDAGTRALITQGIGLRLNVNGTLRQQGSTTDMLFGIENLVSWLSHRFTLLPGDLIFTGTPEGVKGVQTGDFLQAELLGTKGECLQKLEFRCE